MLDKGLAILYDKIDFVDADIRHEYRLKELEIGSVEHIDSRISELYGVRRELIEEIELISKVMEG